MIRPALRAWNIGEDVGVLLQLERQRGAGRVQHAGRHVEALAGDLELGAGVPQDQVAVPVDEVGQQHLVGAPAPRSRGARRRTSPGARPRSAPGRKWYDSSLALQPTSDGELLRRVDVVGQPVGVVEDLGQPAQARRDGRGRTPPRGPRRGRPPRRRAAASARRRSPTTWLSPSSSGPTRLSAFVVEASQRSQIAPRSPTSYWSSGSPSRRPGGRKSRATHAGSHRSTPSPADSSRSRTARRGRVRSPLDRPSRRCPGRSAAGR